MSKMYVGREECGCVVAIMLEIDGDYCLSELKEWLKNGYVVRLEEHNELGSEKCAKHSKVPMFKHSAYSLTETLDKINAVLRE